MRVLLLTGPGGDAQGWGDLSVTRSVQEAIDATGHSARIGYVETEADFLREIDRGNFDILWSALYHITPNESFIGRNEDGMWIADVLDARGIPYIGSDSRTMKNMIDKYQTHRILAQHEVAVPAHHLADRGVDLSAIRFPAFVKPMCESRSVGISDDSVVYSEAELRRQIKLIEREYGEAALVEDFLPGDEFTVLVLGNGKDRSCLPGLVTVESRYYGKHKVLRSDLRGVGLTRIHAAGERGPEVVELAARAAEAMQCLDHVRIDIKDDADGCPKIIEVNGIPGLKPYKSWAPQLYTIHYGSPEGEMHDYRMLIRCILEAAGERCHIKPA